MYKYPVIIFEGIEASGKSTNVENVSKYIANSTIIKKIYIKNRLVNFIIK